MKHLVHRRAAFRIYAISLAFLIAAIGLQDFRTSAFSSAASSPAAVQGPGIFYTVLGTADNTNAVIQGGTGTSADPFQMVSLRGAVLNANTQITSVVGPITIRVPAGTYLLSVDNPNTPAITGTINFPDIEVGSNFNRTTTIVGTGGTPRIEQTVAFNDVITTGFADAFFTPQAVNLTLSNLEITGGGFSGIFTGVDNATGKSDTTIIDCNVHGNSNSFGQGGGIFNQTGNLTIQNTTFSNNTAAFQGGAIFYDLPNAAGPGSIGNFVVTGSRFNANVAQIGAGFAAGGAIFVAAAGTGNTLSITNSSFTNNSASGGGSGGAIASVSNNALSVNLSRFFSNTATSGGTALAHQGTGAVDATNNWWGCDDFPGAVGCGTVSGPSIDSDPRIDLVFTAAASSVCPSGSTVLTADFRNNSDDVLVNPTSLDGATVTFAVTSGPGSVSPLSAAISGATASTTYTAAASGTANISATLDNGTETTSVSVGSGPTTTDPADVTVCQGEDANFSTTASGNGPFSYAWTLDGNPFNGDSPSIIVPTGSLSVGSHTVAVTVTDFCGSTTSQSATLTVNAPTATTDPADVSACQGEDANFSTTASGTGPFSYAWTLDGNPFNGDSPNITIPTGALSPGNHTVQVTTTGACGSAVQTATLTVGGTPVITLSTNTISVWPPNHVYQTFNVTDFVASASSTCDPTVDINDVKILKVSSDEPENSAGADGNTVNDIVIAGDCKSVQLRRERDSNLNGRVYTITFKVTDSFGNSTTATATVTVPITQNGGGAVDDGPAAGYTVNSLCP